MSQHAFDFLTESPLFAALDDSLVELSEQDIRSELVRYRAHVLGKSVERSNGLSVAISAHQKLHPAPSELKQSVLYFDDVMLPDPVFAITEVTRDRVHMPWDTDELDRDELVSALRYMRDLTPMIRLGRVRFIPSSHALEGPTKPPILLPDDAFAGAVPDPLRSWFDNRVRVRKVVTDEQNRRLILPQAPDATTQSISIDFGQLGLQRTQDYMQVVKITETGFVIARPAPPADGETMRGWLKQSVNKAAGDFLQEVLTDAGTAWSLGASYVTSCDATADLLDRLRARSDNEARAALALELPMVQNATYAQIEELLETEAAAFDAFRFELKVAAEAVASIDDPAAREAEAKKASDRLARDQVYEVDRKLREATRKLKWNIPITLAALGAGAIGFATGAHTLFLAAGAALPGSSAIMSMLRDQQGYRALPGYFLWRLTNR